MNDQSKSYPNIDMVRTGIHLRTVMEQAGYDVKTLQQQLHLSCPQPIYRWFQGKILPSVDHLYMLSRLLGRHMEDLLVPVTQKVDDVSDLKIEQVNSQKVENIDHLELERTYDWNLNNIPDLKIECVNDRKAGILKLSSVKRMLFYCEKMQEMKSA